MRPAWLKFPPPLSITIPALVLVICFVGILVNAAILARYNESDAELRAQQVAADQARRLAKIEEKGVPDGVLASEAVYLASSPAILWMGVCDADGAILTSTKPEWQGKNLTEVENGKLVPLLKRTLITNNPSTLTDGETHHAASHPISSPKIDKPLFVIVDRSISDPVLALKRSSALRQAKISSLVLVIACGFLWAVLHYILSKRMRQFMGSARIAASWASEAKPLSGADEFAQLSRAIKDSESLFHQIAEHSRDVFYMLSRERKVLYVSPAYKEIWGVPAGFFEKDLRPWLDTVVEEDRQLFLTMLDPLFQKNPPPYVMAEYRIRRPDGGVRWLESRAFPVNDSDGNFCRIGGLTQDITERRKLEKEVLDVSDKERRRLGNDLHDDLCQRLAAIKLRCELLASSLDMRDPMIQTDAREISAQLGESAILCRNLARGLSPVNLEGEGLMHALEKLVMTSKSLYNVLCYFECPEPVVINNNVTATHLYRIAQELITNAAKHAMPSRVYVRLLKGEKHVRLEVTNDGSVFAEPVQNDDQGMGLRIIRYRACIIGASVQFLRRSHGMAGTAAICLVPEAACEFSHTR